MPDWNENVRFYIETEYGTIEEVVEVKHSNKFLVDFRERNLTKRNLSRWLNKDFYLNDLKNSQLSYHFLDTNNNKIDVSRVRSVWYEEEEKS